MLIHGLGSVRVGNDHGRGFRDVELEKKVLELTRNVGIGAQFGGKYFCHDVRVIRLPRHGASCPVGIGVSCSADRQVCRNIEFLNIRNIYSIRRRQRFYSALLMSLLRRR